jgi:hypothetical protein
MTLHEHTITTALPVYPVFYVSALAGSASIRMTMYPCHFATMSGKYNEVKSL